MAEHPSCGDKIVSKVEMRRRLFESEIVVENSVGGRL